MADGWVLLLEEDDWTVKSGTARGSSSDGAARQWSGGGFPGV